MIRDDPTQDYFPYSIGLCSNNLISNYHFADEKMSCERLDNAPFDTSFGTMYRVIVRET